MFEIRNETEVWYKTKEMPDWVHYGSLLVTEPIEKEKLRIVKPVFIMALNILYQTDILPFLQKKKNCLFISRMMPNLPLWKCRRICMNSRNSII